MGPVEVLNIPTKSPPFSVQDYTVNVYLNGEFVIAYRHRGWSGNEVMDEMRDYRTLYPPEQGYTFEW